MPSANYDLGYLKAAVDLLREYLLSDEIYWQLNASAPSGEPAYPSLTLGGLLIAQARIQARALTSRQQTQYTQLVQKIDLLRTKWRSAWERKSKKEFQARLNLWRDFLDEYRRDPDDNADRYAYEVSRRVMLQLLEKEIDQLPKPESVLLSGLDGILSGLLTTGEFIWDEKLASGFPRGEYPYLYGNLAS
jgi:hypothetical protein